MVNYKLALVLLAATATLLGTVSMISQQQVSDKEPPTWPLAFEESFDETFKANNKTEIVNGILYYDAAHNRSRLDRANGAYDAFCGSLQPNVTTTCVSLVTEGKRYVYFPNKKKCCMCCDAEHGCGILKPDWLNGATYEGESVLDQHKFDQWSKDGVVGYNYYWNTPDDNRIPRKIDENGEHLFNFNIYSYKKRDQNQRLFDIPDYCKSSCPASSTCGKFQNSQLSRSNTFMI